MFIIFFLLCGLSRFIIMFVFSSGTVEKRNKKFCRPSAQGFSHHGPVSQGNGARKPSDGFPIRQSDHKTICGRGAGRKFCNFEPSDDIFIYFFRFSSMSCMIRNKFPEKRYSITWNGTVRNCCYRTSNMWSTSGVTLVMLSTRFWERPM